MNENAEKAFPMRIVPEISLTLEEIAEITDSNSKGFGKKAINGITTNSKEVCQGDLFIALKGERFNGEDFVNEANIRGAYILSSENKSADFKVNDTLSALVKIASYYKTKLPKLKKTVAITGSVGKTTTKNILSKMLSVNFKVHATKENYNNFLGLSHTILTAPKNTEIIIAEVGMNHLGEISVLSKALLPDVSIITNIGTAHIGNLGSREKIAEAKLEILSGMKEYKITVPFEEELLRGVKGSYTVSLTNPKADCFISLKKEDVYSSVFDIFTVNSFFENVKISLPGKHVLWAIGHSIGAIELLNLDIPNITKSISVLDEKCVRGNLININGYKIFDDTYSSSPEAIIADFQLLSLRNTQKSCVLGDMLELGNKSEKLHKKIGHAVVEYNFRNLYTFGKLSSFIAKGALEAGMKKENIFINPDISSPETTAKQIIDNYFDGETLLFKASHSIHAERIYDCLKSASKKT